MTVPPDPTDTALLDEFSIALDNASESHPYCHVSKDGMRACLTGYREIIANCRDSIRTMHEQGASGIRICMLLSSMADRLILHIARETGIHTHPGLEFAVAALGGYGRSELNPGSDIDILFVFADGSVLSYDNEIQLFMRFLWDMNFQVGHSVRFISDCIEAAEDDLNLATSLLESRFLLGNQEILNEFRVRYGVWLRKGHGRALAQKKINERNERIARNGGTVNSQVPNIKEGPGGLRDIHTSRWILQFLGMSGSFQGLLDSNLLYNYEYNEYLEDFDYLLRVRNTAHFIAGRSNDRLEHLALPDIAANLDHDGSRKSRTELFMSNYYRHTGRVNRLTNHITGRFEKLFEPPVAHTLRSDPSGLVVIDQKLGISVNRELTLHETPELIMQLFAFAAEHNLEISGQATSAIERTVHLHKPDMAGNTAVQSIFREMVEARKGLGAAFRLMHEHGILSLVLPEFGNIHWHYQYNFYHAYTTDEHSIRVVENIDRIEHGTLPALAELTPVIAEVTAKSALYLAGLLHDIGKGKGEGHSLKGERLAAQALSRIGSDERTIRTVRFLIREHLLMTHISQRRDMDDENTIIDFIRRVGSMGKLKMLTVLTAADLMAVSDNALTEWKKTLLLRLYKRAMMLLDRGFENPPQTSAATLAKRVLRTAGPDISEQDVIDHLSMLPEQYGRVTSPAEIRAHLTGIDRIDSEKVWVSFHHSRNLTYLTVITRDYTSALFDICGTITASDINIVAAQIFTRRDGIIIDTFMVVDGEGEPRIGDEARRAFKGNLKRVIADEVTAQSLIDSHTRRWRRRRKEAVLSPPRINIHNDISGKYTVIDVFANDYTGLLYDILQVLSSFDIDIHTAKIGTDEDQVADAFYVQRKGGGKIEDPDRLKELSRAIIKILGQTFDDKAT